NMGDMWRGVNDRSDISRMENIINKISDTTSGAINAESSTDGVVGFVKDVLANDTVKAVGNTILESVPGIMSALETLTEIHPFLKAAHLPFKLIYHQETQRRDNDRKRTTLFEKIKDVMLVLLELKDFKKDDTRTTPDNKPVLSRLASLCKDMKKDIEECYNVLNAQEKRSIGIKFLKATAWNKELGSYASRFTNRREQLTFALSMRTAVTIEEMNSKMMEMFSTMLTPQERDMGRWIQQNGGEKAMLGSYTKCAAMASGKHNYEASVAAMSGPVGHADKAEEDPQKKEEKAIATLQKEYREDMEGIIQENFESYSKRFEMGLDDLGKDLGNKIQHQGDRLIKYLRGGPHQRIKDKMVYHVWKDQGWKGSAKTRTLVLALRDYFVERIEHSKVPSTSKDVAQKQRPISSVPKDEDDEDDPESDISVPLPDSWMSAYLQIKRLRYLEEALDPDSSGFTTASEINAFTRARPEDWSFPRWISYWAIGWQIYATKYCVEIEELFGQMNLLKSEIAVKMPGNTCYVNLYFEGSWQGVTALTSSIERNPGEPWLEEKFSGYIESQETILKERLGKIQYDIDAIETVSLLLRGDRIEGSIFILLALLMRRHVAKMHLCLKQEIDSKELLDDLDTIQWVVDAVWNRFVDLKEQFQHQEIADLKLIFERLSCGLFKNYWKWDNWLQPKYFMENDMTVWTSDTIRALDPSELVGILAHTHTDTPGSKSNDFSDTTPSVDVATESAAVECTPTVDPASAVPTVEALSTDKITEGESNPVLSQLSEAEMSITGMWHGWHSTDTRNLFTPMVSFKVQCEQRQPESESVTKISGGGVGSNGNTFTLSGTMDSAGDQPVGSLSLSFERIYTVDGTWIQYKGTFNPDRGVMTGIFGRTIANGSFLFKKVPMSAIMCSRPIVPELNTKQLWSFALNAVVDGLRRKKPSSWYIRERMIDIRRLLGFLYRDTRGLAIEPEEQPHYSKLLKQLSVEEMVEVNKLYNWNGYSCDGCGTDPTEPSTSAPKPECIASENIPQRTDVQHRPSHLMVRFRDLLLLKDYFAVKQRAGYVLSFARHLYQDPTEDPSLTIPLPASPIADESSSSEPKVNTEANVTTQTGVPTIVDDSPTPIPIPVNAQKLATLSLPALDTAVSPTTAPDPGTPGSESGINLLTAAVTPVETTQVEDQTLNCVVCHERIVAPCWSCVTCYNNTWVCDSCDKVTNELAPWDYQKLYRSQVAEIGGKDDGSAHTVFHSMVRVARVQPEPDGNDNATAAAANSDPEQHRQWEQIEKRIQELVTARFEAVNSHVDKRLDEVEAKLSAGLANIERLLMAGQSKS
ncbi:hypothetical protein B0H12DRAFT_1135296, partial [Mycena haematopus]